MRLGLQEALVVGRIDEPLVIDVPDEADLRRDAPLVVDGGRGGIGWRAAREAVQRGGGALLEELGIGHAQSHVGAESGLGLAEAVLREHGGGKHLGLADLAHAVDRPGTPEFMLERHAERHVHRPVVGHHVIDAAGECGIRAHIYLGVGEGRGGQVAALDLGRDVRCTQAHAPGARDLRRRAGAGEQRQCAGGQRGGGRKG